MILAQSVEYEGLVRAGSVRNMWNPNPGVCLSVSVGGGVV